MCRKILLSLVILFLFCLSLTLTAYAEEEWIYYSNTNDSGRLYKIRSDGTGITRLGMQRAADFEVLGDWIYYYNQTYSGGAFRTKIDGSVTERLIDGSVYLCNGIYKDNNRIYFSTTYNTSVYGEYGFISDELWGFDSQGNISKVCLNFDESNSINCISVNNNNVYFSSESNGKTEYYAAKLNINDRELSVSSKKQIKKLPDNIIEKADEQCLKKSDTDYFREKYLCWKSVNNADRYIIYALNEKSGKYRKINETTDTEISLTVLSSRFNDEYKVTAVKKINGSEKKYKVKMLDKQNVCSVNSFAVGNKNVYYICKNDGIYRIIGEKSEKIKDGKTEHLCIDDNYIYFTLNGQIRRMNYDGTGEKIFTSVYNELGINPDVADDINITVYCMAVFNDKILVSLDSGDESYDVHTLLINTDDSKAEEVNTIKINGICFVDDKIIFTADDRNIYSMKQDGSELYSIAEAHIHSPYSWDDIYSYNGMIYLCSNYGIYRMNSDGTDVRCIYKGNVNDIEIYNDRIYFITQTEVGEKFETQASSINADGTDLVVHMNDGVLSSINICGDALLVTNTSGDYSKIDIE